ncbi:hypothetical protein [Arthrobacter oryzae]|uniref:hypothetical protein n=1 Tax=Arthrobacter oryzae TaxID=409290 RepID=UPI002789869B|nr:hypothetical protein [Arthrobacter oryzae]MDQ0078499.1 transposase-like protein/type III secretory pathway component EscS [Arthrobacter oryzae]
MEVDEDVRRKAVSAVLDGGMTQVSVCRQYGLKAHRLRVWLSEEKLRRANLHRTTSDESTEVRLNRLIGEWGTNAEAFGRQLHQGLKRAKSTNTFFTYLGFVFILVTFALNVLVAAVIGALITGYVVGADSWQAATFNSLAVVVVGGVVVVGLFAIALYFAGLVYRVCAPFAYSVSNLRHAWENLELHGAEMFEAPKNRQEKLACKDITKSMGRAAQVLDVTRRRGRVHGSPLSKEGERSARRNVAASIGGAEDLLWHHSSRAFGPAVEIMQIAAYETVLRRWALHDLKHLAEQMRPSLWERRIYPALKGAGAFGTTVGTMALQIFGAEDQTPSHLIRGILESRGWIPL